MSLTSVDLPLPLTPVTAMKHPSGNSTSIPARLCSCASRTASHASPGWRRISGTATNSLPDEEAAGDGASSLAMICLSVPGDHDLAAVLARTRTDVDDVVGDADRLFVVLHHDDGVAEVTQAHEGVDEPLRCRARCSPIDGSSST